MSDPPLGFVHRWVPPGPHAVPVTLLLLHGTGGTEDDLLPIGRAIAPDAGLLSPRGKVLERGLPRFFRRLAEGVLDQADLRVRAGELAAFVSSAATAYGFDPVSVVAVGFSNGANIAAGTMLLHPATLAGAVLLRAMVPLEPDERPDLTGRQVLVSAGRRDPMVPPGHAERLTRMLREAGAGVTLAWRDAGHQLTPEDVDDAADWLARAFGSGDRSR